MKNFMKKTGIILFTLMLVAANMGIFAAAEETGTRKTEGRTTKIEMDSSADFYGILIHKVDKNGEKALSGSVFKGYQTDETWDLETAVPMKNYSGSEYQVYPDQDTGTVDVDNPAHLLFATWPRRAYIATEYYVLQEVVSPDGYEHETGKLYYLIVEYNPTSFDEEHTIKIAPQSQDDAYISDDNKYIVLENTKLTPDDPAEGTVQEDPLPDQPNEMPAGDPADPSGEKNPAEPDYTGELAGQDTSAVTKLPETADDFSVGIIVMLLALSGSTIGILCIRKMKNRNQM